MLGSGDSYVMTKGVVIYDDKGCGYICDDKGCGYMLMTKGIVIYSTGQNKLYVT